MTLAFPPSAVLASHAAVAVGIALALLASRPWPLLYALLLWPGTLAHELCHFVVGLLLGAQPVALEVWPRRMSQRHWQLGEVRFAQLRWWNKVPVGLAPLLLLPLGAWLFWQTLAWPAPSWSALGGNLLAVQCLLAAWPSQRDLLHVLAGLLVLALLGGLVYLLLLKLGLLSWLSRFAGP